jgi:hypothetical protein
MKNQKLIQTAETKAKEKVEFRIHLITYIVINVLLMVINLTLTPGYIWFIWPLFGWGIGIILHTLRVYFSGEPSLKERMIEKEMKKH